jgi:LmbE family N-acetylglucosaminyl deacetylase
MTAVLAVSPHPDDEIVGAGATLMALRDAGWRVVNLACDLGRPEDVRRRRRELELACRLARFELEIPDGLPGIGASDDLPHAQRVLSEAIMTAVQASGADVLIGPWPHDGHHGHEVVGRAILDAVELRGRPRHILWWGLWADLPFPNLYVGFGPARLTELQQALAAHAGELVRNRYDRLLEARATASAVLGPERVFGFGSSGSGDPYAELLTAVQFDGSWRLAPARTFDPAATLTAGDGPDIGRWLHAPSPRTYRSRETAADNQEPG